MPGEASERLARAQVSREHDKRGARWRTARSDSGSLRAYGRDIRKRSRKPVASWSVREVGDWLEKLGLDEYRGDFEARGVDGRAALELSLDDLDSLGVKQRKQLLRGIAELNNAASADPVPLAAAGGEWKNPTSLLDGQLDEAAEHLAFQRAVEAWRRPRKVADDLAAKLDASHADHIQAIARRKQLLQEEHPRRATIESTTITLVESRLGCSDDGGQVPYTVIETS